MKPSLIIAVCALLTACGAGAVAPFFQDAEAITDARLVGTWRDSADASIKATIRANGPAYDITYVNEEGKTGTFEAHLFRRGPDLLLDVLPADLPDSTTNRIAPEYWSLLIRLHGLLRVQIAPNRLTVGMLASDTLKVWMAAHAGDTPHLISDSTLVLTGSAAQVRAFLTTYARQPHAFATPDVWLRVGNTQPH